MAPGHELFVASELLLMVASFADVPTLLNLLLVDSRCNGLMTPVLYKRAVENNTPVLHWASEHGNRETLVSFPESLNDQDVSLGHAFEMLQFPGR